MSRKLVSLLGFSSIVGKNGDFGIWKWTTKGWNKNMQVCHSTSAPYVLTFQVLFAVFLHSPYVRNLEMHSFSFFIMSLVNFINHNNLVEKCSIFHQFFWFLLHANVWQLSASVYVIILWNSLLWEIWEPLPRKAEHMDLCQAGHFSHIRLHS